MKKKRTVKTYPARAICVSQFWFVLIVTQPGLIARAANRRHKTDPARSLKNWPAYGGAPETSLFQASANQSQQRLSASRVMVL